MGLFGWVSQVVPVIKNPPGNAEDIRDVGSIPGLGRFPWRRKWQPTPLFLPGKFNGQQSLVGYSLNLFPISLAIDNTIESTYLFIYCFWESESITCSHLGCFHVLAMVNSAVVSTGVHVSLWIMVSFELYSVLCGDLNGKEIQGRGNICTHVADSLCCTAETNTTF